MPMRSLLGRTGAGGWIPTDIGGCILWLRSDQNAGLLPGDTRVDVWSNPSSIKTEVVIGETAGFVGETGTAWIKKHAKGGSALARNSEVAFQPVSQPFCFCGWYYLRSIIGVDNGIFGKWWYPNLDSEYSVGVVPGVGIQFWVSPDGTDANAVKVGSTPTATGAWKFVYCESTPGGNAGISINNGALETAAAPASVHQGTRPLWGGIHDYISAVLDGGLCSWGFWKGRVLSTTERTWMYNGGNGRRYSELTADHKVNLVEWWNMSEKSGTRVGQHAGKNLSERGAVGYYLGGKAYEIDTFCRLYAAPDATQFDRVVGTPNSFRATAAQFDGMWLGKKLFGDLNHSSIIMWIKVIGTSVEWPSIINDESDAGKCACVSIHCIGGDRHYVYARNRGGWDYEQAASNLALNTWHCVGHSFSTENGVKLYLNGQPDGVGDMNTPTDALLIQCRLMGVALEYMDMEYGDIACYTGELTAAQFLTFYKETKARYGL